MCLLAIQKQKLTTKNYANYFVFDPERRRNLRGFRLFHDCENR